MIVVMSWRPVGFSRWLVPNIRVRGADRIALTAGHDGTGQGARMQREGAQSNGPDYGCDLGSPANFYSNIQLSNRLSQAVVKTHVTH
jgi:hypothetical protein